MGKPSADEMSDEELEALTDPEREEAEAKAEVESKVEDGEEVRDAIAETDGYDGEVNVALGPKPLVDARVAQAERAEARPILSPMARRFHERRHLGSRVVVTRRDVNERTQGPGERVRKDTVEAPGEVAGVQPVTGGSQHMQTHTTGRS